MVSMKKILSALTVALMVVNTTMMASAAMKPGTYTETVTAMHGPMTVEVTVSEDKIESVKVTDHVETPGVGDIACEEIPAAIVEHQSLAVDAVTGVTISSRSILYAAEKALKAAGADVKALNAPLAKPAPEDKEMTADVVIVGGGGAGLSAAVAATEAGSSVILVEKSGFLGGNSIVAGGIYNAPEPALQDYAEFSGNPNSLVEAALAEAPVSEEHKALQDKVRAEYEEFKKTDKKLFDSPAWFALQTWNGGDKVAELKMVEILTENALPTLKDLQAKGMEFSDFVVFGGGALYQRTHRAIMPNGTGYIKVYREQLAKQGDKYTQLMNTEGKSLILDGDKVVGVEAVAKDGSKLTLRANKGVILATGGFAGNMDLRVKYCQGEKWPDLGAHVITSNMPAVTGDGIFMAEAAGAELVNMNQIQFLPYCDPNNGATYNIMGNSSTAAFINKEGKRFVREDGRRDEMSKGIMAQTDGMMYLVFSTDTIGTTDLSKAKSLGGDSLQYYLDNNLYGYVMADTLEELAEKINIPADALVQTIQEFNGYVENGGDPYGRVTFGTKIENGPFFAYPRKPAAHHTMGGVRINEKAQALKADGTPVEGLFCAGEITGVIHGGNRLGGNAIVDFAVFGRIAGQSAAAN